MAFEERLHALVAEGGAAHDGGDGASEGRSAQRLLQLGGAYGVPFDIVDHRLVVHFRQFLDHLLPVAGAHLGVLLGHRHHVGVLMALGGKYQARSSTRSMTPSKEDSTPIGIWIATGWPFRRALIASMVRQKSAPMRSILLTKQMRGTL